MHVRNVVGALTIGIKRIRDSWKFITSGTMLKVEKRVLRTSKRYAIFAMMKYIGWKSNTIYV